MKTIVLIGFMGAGKTSIGKILSQNLKIPFFDTDKVIESKMSKNISQIFQEKGEVFFRKLETQTLLEICQNSPQAIIATGGGCIHSEKNCQILQNLKGIIFWLKVNPQTAYKRTQTTKKERPLLQNQKNPLQYIEDKIAQRNPIYQKVANIIIETDKLSFNKIAQKIEQEISSQ